MPLRFHKEGGELVWVENPFTGTVTYFTDLLSKRSGFAPRAVMTDERARRQAEEERFAELEAARRNCPFCPANEHLTPPEVLRVLPEEVKGAEPGHSWLIRAFPNLTPRLPPSCTGGRNESYVVVEDPRHFAEDPRHNEDVLCTSMLSPQHFRVLLGAVVSVAHIAKENPAVKSVLIRKNQGRESGASQPHVHSQVIGVDRELPPVVQEWARLREEPGLWRDIVAFAEGEGFVVQRCGSTVLYFCPFGAFPRSYEIVNLEQGRPITDIDPGSLNDFADLLHKALCLLGPLPLDFELHDGQGVPLHAHVNSRYFPYSNMGGTLNLPSGVPAQAWSFNPAARSTR